MLGTDTLVEELVENLPDSDSISVMKEIANKYDVDLNGVDDFLYIDDEEWEMKVNELIKILKKLDKDALVVKRANGYSWKCYEPLKDIIKETELFSNGSVYEEVQDTEEEPSVKMKVIIIP